MSRVYLAQLLACCLFGLAFALAAWLLYGVAAR